MIICLYWLTVNSVLIFYGWMHMWLAIRLKYYNKHIFGTLRMSSWRLWYATDVFQTFKKCHSKTQDVFQTCLVRYGCLPNVLTDVIVKTQHVFQMSLVCYVFQTSLVHLGCLNDVFFILWMYKKTSFVAYEYLKTFFVRYECLKDVFCTLWMSQRWILYIIDV